VRRWQLWRLAGRLRRRLPPTSGVPEEALLPQQIAKDFEAEELREFLAPDPRLKRADPAFRERLRQRLWALVQQGNGGDRPD
jgi:hypothetical protein